MITAVSSTMTYPNISNTDLWNIVAESPKIYNRYIEPEDSSMYILNIMFKYSKNIKQYNLKCDKYQFVQDNTVTQQNWYELTQTQGYQYKNYAYPNKTTFLCTIGGRVDSARPLVINMNGCNGGWEFIIQLKNPFGLTDKLYHCTMINPTYAMLLKEFETGIIHLTCE